MPGNRSSSDDKATLRFYAEEAETYVASGPGGASRICVIPPKAHARRSHPRIGLRQWT